jgi:hypothetical protein
MLISTRMSSHLAEFLHKYSVKPFWDLATVNDRLQKHDRCLRDCN